MQKNIERLVLDDSGATSIEYALLAAVVAIACIASVRAFGDSLNGVWSFINTTVNGVL